MNVREETHKPPIRTATISSRSRKISPLPSENTEVEAHLTVAGEGGVVEQKVGTEEEDNGVKHAEACPVQEHRPAEEGVLRYVSEESEKTKHLE